MKNFEYSEGVRNGLKSFSVLYSPVFFQRQGPRQGQDGRPAEVKRRRHDNDDDTDLKPPPSAPRVCVCSAFTYCSVVLGYMSIGKISNSIMENSIKESQTQNPLLWHLSIQHSRMRDGGTKSPNSFSIFYLCVFTTMCVECLTSEKCEEIRLFSFSEL